MGLIARISMLIKSKMSQLLDRAENPSETLDYSYERQLEMLQKVKRGIVEVVTSKRRLELQASRLRDQVAKLDGQARQAVSMGRDDLATVALQRKQVAAAQLEGLDTQITDLEKEQEKLTSAEQRLTLKIESFRTRKETIKAQYAAAEAQVRIGEAVSGLSEEMADVGMAIERAEDKTERLRARAGAIDELVDTGVLEDVSGSDALTRQLQASAAQQNVSVELTEMKRQLAGGGQKQLPGEGGNQS